MKTTYLIAAVCIAFINTPVAGDDHPSENSHMKTDSPMPMHDKEKNAK